MAIIRVTKTDVATRQLETAIRLFFEERDPVSIHTLASAALDVLRGIGLKRGVRAPLKDYPFIRPEYRKTFYEAATRHQMFFKHADRDPEGVSDFNPGLTEFVMIDALELYRLLNGNLTKTLWVFRIYAEVKHPRFFIGSEKRPELKTLPSPDNKIAWLSFLNLYTTGRFSGLEL